MRYSEDFIQKVMDASSVVEEISQFTQLSLKGGKLFGLCPYPNHNEKTPSFSVNEAKQLYYCFGCQQSGNVFNFLRDIKGFSFPESVEYLANKAGIPLPVQENINRTEDEKRREERQLQFRVNQFASRVFHHNLMGLPEDHPVRVYCRTRGMTDEILETFQLGYSPDEWEFLSKKLLEKKAPMHIAEKVGLVKKRKSGDGYFDFFKGRLIFPIVSHKSQHVGFGGRILTDVDQAKYLNSPESHIFNKGKLFYGLNESAKHIRVSDYVVVVEGYMDLIALYRAGIKNAVATLGTALTSDHARLIQRYTKNVVVMFDGDAAGIKAAERSLPILLEAHLMPKACILPDGNDPDDFLRDHGADHLLGKVAESKDLFTLLLNEKLKTLNINDPISKVRVIDDISPTLKRMADKRLQQLYINQVSEKLGESTSWVVNSLKGAKVPQKPQHLQGTPAPEPRPTQELYENSNKISVLGAVKAELFLLNLSLLSKESYEKVLESGAIAELMNSGVRDIFNIIDHQHRQLPNEFDKLTALLMNIIEPSKALNWHIDPANAEMPESAIDKMISDCSHQIRTKNRRIKTKQLAANINNLSPDEQRQKLEQIMNMYRENKVPEGDSHL